MCTLDFVYNRKISVGNYQTGCKITFIIFTSFRVRIWEGGFPGKTLFSSFLPLLRFNISMDLFYCLRRPILDVLDKYQGADFKNNQTTKQFYYRMLIGSK